MDRAHFLTIVTGSLPVPPPTTIPRRDPHLLSFEAELVLSQGRKRHAEWRSRKAEAMRQAGR